MIKEIIVFSLLMLIIFASIMNISYTNKLSILLTDEINKAEASAAAGNYKAAEDHLKSALNLCDSNRNYYGIFLRHPDIDSLYDCFYELEASIKANESESIPAICSKLRYHIRNIADMEKLRLSSIL